MTRVEWSEKHQAHAYWFEKAAGSLAFIIGCAGAWAGGAGIFQYFCFAIAAFGINAMLPSSRPLFSSIVDRLPFLASKDEE